MTDLMAEQLRLEERMASLGVDKYRDAYQDNLQHGAASDSRSVKTALDAAIEPVAAAIEQFREEALAGKAGRRHSAVKAIDGLDAVSVAYITLKLVLDGIVRDRELTVLANRVGAFIETEQRLHSYEKKNPVGVKNAQRLLESRTGHADHRRRALMAICAQGQDGWTPWSTSDKVIVGIKLIEIVAVATGLIEIETLKIKRRPIAMVSITDRFKTWLDQLNLQSEIMFPEYLPCIVPPKDWDGLTGGGYHSDAFAYPLRLVKTRSKKHMRLLKKADLSLVYKAVNAIQRTPWSVNQKVLEVADHLMRGGAGVAGLPADVLPLPTKPTDIDTNEEARKAWRRLAAITYETNTSLKSRRVQAFKTLAVASEFSNYDAIYFPYQLDFRGRIYAVASGLNPQGTDLSKGLLQFSSGDPITRPEQLRWFLIHGANCFGVDKVSFDERVAWTAENRERILSCAKAPLDDLWWTEADSPFCFLAWAFEYLEMGWPLQRETPFVSRLPIAMDGSCNGLQHYSAMLQDPVAGRAVNLVPSDKPQDIYGVVADWVMGELKRITRDGTEEEQKWAFAWRHVGIDRKITKRPVMVLPYGGTLNSCQKYVADAVMDKGNLPFSDEEKSQAINWLASIVWKGIGETVVSARLAMGWLRKVAGTVVKEGEPLHWTTPSGFPVFQFYPEMKQKRLNTLLFGERFAPRVSEELPDQIDARRQVNGVAPNFVHSLDASALVLTVCAAVDKGINKFAMIHDSYGTTAHHSAILPYLDTCNSVSDDGKFLVIDPRGEISARNTNGLSDELYRCDDCEEPTHEDDRTYVDTVDRHVCSSCLNDGYFFCEEMNDYYPDDRQVETDCGTSLSDRGAERGNWFYCEETERWYDGSRHESVELSDGRTVSADWAEEHCYWCEYAEAWSDDEDARKELSDGTFVDSGNLPCIASYVDAWLEERGVTMLGRFDNDNQAELALAA
ncbi:hypothetical protein JQ506_07795 [Shinella sp. PSBB067]|uniref:DNA-directed RNA polymerase n=1 Tax=Shinella sp. PSBB067 TaxID=2715959 RepID=UPI00193C458E|nr:DNA-directed RNA polymerase [Shinella sp. PSBB067]QRI64883.1 hypothetical protein JQ506_07795 [Shinella sp. PSBB067]